MQRPFRLRASADFARLRESGRTWRHPLLSLSVIPNGLPHNRYGYIISKHVGNAVIRNRTRRRLRELMRAAHPHLQAGFDLVWIARNQIADQPYNLISDAVSDLLRRARLMRVEN
jgi:ribonuclease P protein component